VSKELNYLAAIGHFACLCRGFEFYEVKEKNSYYFSKKKMEILAHF
jgi:hypothetical protein